MHVTTYGVDISDQEFIKYLQPVLKRAWLVPFSGVSLVFLPLPSIFQTAQS